MYLKKFLNQPNAVGSVLIALLFSAGVLFAFGFNGFNVQSVGEDDVNSLLLMTASECCGGNTIESQTCSTKFSNGTPDYCEITTKYSNGKTEYSKCGTKCGNKIKKNRCGIC